MSFEENYSQLDAMLDEARMAFDSGSIHNANQLAYEALTKSTTAIEELKAAVAASNPTRGS